jgi:hypothetical protein
VSIVVGGLAACWSCASPAPPRAGVTLDWAAAATDELPMLRLDGPWIVTGQDANQAPNSATGQDAGQAAGQAAGQDAARQEQPKRLRTWEMPPIEVVGEPLPELREEELIGPYKQPRWTAHRRFPTTRVYVIPEGKVAFEYWMRVDEPQHGEPRVRNYYEMEWGFADRLQLDVYLVADHTGENEPTEINQEMVELRWALADWGELWGNPTLYFELVNRHHDPEKVEAKLLLGDQLAPGWHWGSNVVVEQETGGSRERELELTYGISKTVIDETFSVGAEAKAAAITEKGARGDPTYEFFVGPSFQYRPSERTHVDFAPLVGVGGDSPNAQIWLIVGWEF